VLEALDMWECGIGPAGARALATALRSNSNLRTLELRGNPMGDAGARAFAEIMPENKPLATLDLLNTGVSDAGRADLRAGLAKSRANPYLVIFEDGIGPHQQRTSWEEKGQADAP
jgi:Ran GTPase-activating protein (RanGAP) involved in mRNA processing and transport